MADRKKGYSRLWPIRRLPTYDIQGKYKYPFYTVALYPTYDVGQSYCQGNIIDIIMILPCGYRQCLDTVKFG